MNSDGQMKTTINVCPPTTWCGDKMYDDTTEGREVDILYSDQSLESSLVNDKPHNDKPSGIRSGRMTLTKVDDMWLTEDQLPWR